MDARSHATSVRDIHNAVARSKNLAEASTRGSGVTRRELHRAAEDVISKLDLTGVESVLEIGCGVGVIALPVAARCGRFVGVDFAEQAVTVLNERFQLAGLTQASALCRDASGGLSDLGHFDRVIVYATLHLVDDPAAIVRQAVSLTAPNGLILFGNLPVAVPVRRSRRGQALGLAYRAWRRAARALRRTPFTAATLPNVDELDLDTIKHAFGDLRHEWLAPAVGTPMFSRRVDLIVHQRP